MFFKALCEKQLKALLKSNKTIAVAWLLQALILASSKIVWIADGLPLPGN